MALDIITLAVYSFGYAVQFVAAVGIFCLGWGIIAGAINYGFRS